MSNDNKIDLYLETINTERFNCIYLIYVSPIGQKGLPVFKYGRTRDINHRFNSYPKNSTLLYLCRVKDCYFVEDEIDLMFPKFFKQSKTHGIEYFETNDVKLMIRCIDKLIDKMDQRLNDDMITIIKPIYKDWLQYKVYQYESISDNFCKELINCYKNDTTDYSQRSNQCRTKHIKMHLINKPKSITKIDMDMTKLLEAEDIDKNTYKEYMEDYMSHKSSDEQKYAIEKYLYKQYWSTDNINQNFLDLWFRKTYVINNAKLLLNATDSEKFISLDKFNKNNYLICDTTKQQERVVIIKALIDYMGFNLQKIDELIIDRVMFINNMDKCLKECKIFTDTKNCELLFGCKSKDIKSLKAFIGYVNSLLKNWGLHIDFNKKSIRNANTKQLINIYKYNLNYYQNINKYL